MSTTLRRILILTSKILILFAISLTLAFITGDYIPAAELWRLIRSAIPLTVPLAAYIIYQEFKS